MSDLKLSAIRVVRGTWEGVLTGDTAADDAPAVSVSHRGRDLEGVELTPDTDRPDQWHLRFAIPMEALSGGVQTFLIRDTRQESDLGTFSIAMGDALDHDIRAEVDLLRAELDMLKRAFRRHCLETA
ncbi:hypothetical protein [Oceaniglobus trochenteri]|uniref:hypothetical protein n=1 Tax=Oceaniglobus trochenteri TaxID=2763260 RepID=UPI001D000689|nr:hypothetical protein [Oceaniglobus trochenteri]